MIPGFTLWGKVTNHTGDQRAALALAAVSGTAFVAVEDTQQGFCLGRAENGNPIFSLCLRGLPGGMLTPSFVSKETVDEVLRHERPELVRHVTIRRLGRIPHQLDWWLRREETAAPLALDFDSLEFKVELPGVGFVCGIVGLSVSCVSDSKAVVLDVASNCLALAKLRSITMRCFDSAAQIRNLEALTTLKCLGLFAAYDTVDGTAVAEWAGQCHCLRYLFLQGWGAVTSLHAIAKAPKLISVLLLHCGGIVDLAPLLQSDQLQCLLVRFCDRIGDHQGLCAPDGIRMLAVPRWPHGDGSLLRACSGLDWLEVDDLGDGVTSMDDIVAAAPFIHHLSLMRCSGLENAVLGSLGWLTSLCVDRCTRLGSIDVSALSRLSALTVSYCDALTSVHFGDSLERVSVWRCAALTDIDVSMCTRISAIEIVYADSLHSVRLSGSIQNIFVGWCHALTALDLSMCVVMRKLSLRDCANLQHIQLPPSLVSLKAFCVEGPIAVGTLDLRTATSLTTVGITECGSLVVLRPPGVLSHKGLRE